MSIWTLKESLFNFSPLKIFLSFILGFGGFQSKTKIVLDCSHDVLRCVLSTGPSAVGAASLPAAGRPSSCASRFHCRSYSWLDQTASPRLFSSQIWTSYVGRQWSLLFQSFSKVPIPLLPSLSSGALMFTTKDIFYSFPEFLLCSHCLEVAVALRQKNKAKIVTFTKSSTTFCIIFYLNFETI